MWGSVVSNAIGVLRDEKISGGILVLVLAGFYGVYAWAAGEHDNMVDKAEFKELEQKVDQGFEQMTLNDASQKIRDIKLSLQIAHATQAPQPELDKIQEELEYAKAYKACLVHRDPNCEHLREVE